MDNTWSKQGAQIATKTYHRWLDLQNEEDDFLRGKVPDFFPDLTEDDE